MVVEDWHPFKIKVKTVSECCYMGDKEAQMYLASGNGRSQQLGKEDRKLHFYHVGKYHINIPGKQMK